MKRRTFIQRLASTGIVLPIAMGLPKMRAFAKSPAGSPFMRLASSTNDHVMVLIRLAGGNDGLNTVVPHTDSTYYTARKQGQADDCSIAADTVLKLPDHQSLGLHPSLAGLHELYGEQKVAIIQNVGYPNQNLSHFRSTDIWLSGSDYNVYDNAGWYAKYLEEKYPDYPSVLPSDPFAIEFGTFLSTTLIGENNNMGIALADLSYIPGQPGVDPVRTTHAGDEEAYVRSIDQQSNIFSTSIIAAYAKVLANKVTYPTQGNLLATVLSGVARLIAGGLGTQFYIVNAGGYDTHSDQLTRQKTLHQQLADAVKAFQRDMEAFGLDQRVSLMTISEFGRRVASNGTGTDHGSAAPQFVIGSSVNGGVFGSDPNLTDLESPGNIKMQYDFRQIYASVLGQWYGATDDFIAPKALPRQFDQIPIFKTSGQSGVQTPQYAGALQLGQNFPNPANGSTVIPLQGVFDAAGGRLAIYDVDGGVVFSQAVAPGQAELELSTRGMASGTYVYELTSGGVRRSRTMIVSH
ncbi:MAG TPA: DUF1501 domain-containing protein [Candidatus Kapabacteria bacterium]|nr:DUF1501 domain-containing protein [Candidatus Kapabacteria bacterium]